MWGTVKVVCMAEDRGGSGCFCASVTSVVRSWGAGFWDFCGRPHGGRLGPRLWAAEFVGCGDGGSEQAGVVDFEGYLDSVVGA